LQVELGVSYINVGHALSVSGRPAEALAAFERSLAIVRKVAEANPNVTRLQELQATSHGHIAWAYRLSGRPAEALVEFEHELAIRRKLAEAHPSVEQQQTLMATCLGQIAGVHREAGRHSEAATAARESVAIMERLSVLEPVDCYNLACGYANLAGIAALPGSGMTRAEGLAAAEQAMQWLHRAVARGYRNVAVMKPDHDLDPLRSRPDFQLLMMDLEFPDEPFALSPRAAILRDSSR
jgi:serine/threonine-protein kinase